MKAGDKVYRVVEYDDPLDDDKIADGGPTSWLVEERRVERVRRDGTIQIERPFSDISRRIYRPVALGMTFFATEIEAVDAFRRRRDEIIAQAERSIACAKRGITWAQVWKHRNGKFVTMPDNTTKIVYGKDGS